MGWFFRTEPPAALQARVAALEADAASLRQRLDDLEDVTARRLGRLDKRSGLDAARRDDRPAPAARVAHGGTERAQLQLALQRHLAQARGG